jgi:hypothetical protein
VGSPSVINTNNIPERMYDQYYACGAYYSSYIQSGCIKNTRNNLLSKLKYLPFQKWVVHP